MSARHSDGRHLSPTASIAPGTTDNPDYQLYSNCDDGRVPGSNPGGPVPGVGVRGDRQQQQGLEGPLGGRQISRAMSDAAKAKVPVSRKPMPAPKPHSLSVGKVDAGPRNRKKSEEVCVRPSKEEPLYDEAFVVLKERVVRNDLQKHQPAAIYGTPLPVSGHRLPVDERGASASNANPEPIYDEASTVCVSKIPVQKPRVVLKRSKSTEEENLYDDADLVSKLKLQNLYDDAAAVNKSQLQNLYEDAATVSKSKLQNLYEDTAAVSQPQLQNLYEDAATVSKSKLQNLYEDTATVSQPQLQNLYEDAATVSKSKLQHLYEDTATVSQSQLQNLYEDAATVSKSKLPPAEAKESANKHNHASPEPLYCDAAAVVSNRLPKNEKHAGQKLPQENCGADSSDDDEELHFNLLVLRKTVGSQKLWSCRADPHMGRMKVEQNARRMSGVKVLPTPPPKKFGYLGGVVEDFSDREGASGISFRQNSFDDEWSDDLIGLHTCDETEMKKLRKWIASDILKSERSYCELLESLCCLMRKLIDLVGTGREKVSPKDVETIFHGIPDLQRIHLEFVKNIQPVVEKSSKDCQIGQFLKEMIVNEYCIAGEFLKKHHEAISTFHRCCADSQQFATLAKTLKYRQVETNVEELLRKPIERFQCNALVLHDLKNCTPTSHKDFDLVVKSLNIAKNFLDVCSGSNDNNVEDSRHLVKNGIVVVKPERDRKLRHIFLFNDVLVCCKQKISSTRSHRVTYEVKWYIPLSDLKLEDKFSAQEEKQADIRHQEEISSLKKELVRLQKDLKEEMQKVKTADSQILTHRQNRPLENVRKKLAEQEAKLLVASPHLQLKLLNQANQKSFILLLASDYERTNWKSTIAGLLGKANPPAKLSLADVTNLINSQRIPKLLGALDNNDISLEEERLNGNLTVVIHKLQGLREEADAFCSVEVDSFGHFFTKAKTNRKKGQEPSWSEEFDIDLEGAQSMHILCYKIGSHTDSLLGKCSLFLQKEWIIEDFQNKVISLGNELLLTVSLKYTSPEKLKRMPSSVKSDVFGVKLERIVKKEGKPVPLIVAACTEEIERRGLRDVGIYRVSGLSAEIQRLKKTFNKNSNEGVAGLASVDTNVLAGLVKLFFRELPEALFTDPGYPEFVKGIGLSDPDTKERFLVGQLVGLPACNYATIIHILNHLVKVSQYEEANKMSLMNLATVFGPTLLRPAEKGQTANGTESLFCHGASEVILQSTILLYFLNLMTKNYNFPLPKSSK